MALETAGKRLELRVVPMNPYAPKLTPEIVRAIRADHVWGSHEAGFNALARKYGVSKVTIYHIIHRKTWRDLV